MWSREEELEAQLKDILAIVERVQALEVPSGQVFDAHFRVGYLEGAFQNVKSACVGGLAYFEVREDDPFYRAESAA